MGELNNVLNVYMNRPDRIRSVLELALGEQLPSDWQVCCKEAAIFYADTTSKGKVSYRQRDILKKISMAQGEYYLGIENQTDINLIFPWRMMQMDSLLYENQIEQIKRDNVSSGTIYTSEDDFLYRYRHSDRIAPVINLVLYWGKRSWQTPLSLWDMVEAGNITEGSGMPEKRIIPEPMCRLFQDYRIHVISMLDITDEQLEAMDSDLKYVLGLMKRAYAKEDYSEYLMQHGAQFKNMSKSAVDVLRVCLSLKDIPMYTRYDMEMQEEVTDMRFAWEELLDDAREEGREESKGQVMSVLMRKLEMSAQQVMDLLEIPLEQRDHYLNLLK